MRRYLTSADETASLITWKLYYTKSDKLQKLLELDRIMVVKVRVLRWVFGRWKEEMAGETGEDCVMRGFTTCTLHQI